jgi:hypothetical protein
MLGTIVIGLLTDMVLDAATSSGSQYRSEIRRYLRERGLPTAARPPKSPSK